MIELVVFLHEVVSIVSNQRRAIILTRLLHNSGKVCNHLYQAFLFLAQFNTGRKLCKLDGLTQEEADNIARIVGLGALKYFILKVDARKNMTFNPKESIDFNGNTGPFIQLAQFSGSFLSGINHFSH